MRSGGAGEGGKGGGKCPPPNFYSAPIPPKKLPSPQDGFILCKQLMALRNFKTWPIC